MGDLDPNEYDLGELRDAAGGRQGAGDRGREAEVDPEPEREREREPTGTESASTARRLEVSVSTEADAETDVEADAAGDERHREPGRTDPADGLDRETLSRLDGDASRPYLSRIPEGYDAQLDVLEWLDGLVERGGVEATHEALDHYEAVGWLSADSRARLETFLEGLADGGAPPGGSLGVAAHRRSLTYVARLTSRLE